MKHQNQVLGKNTAKDILSIKCFIQKSENTSSVFASIYILF